MPSPALPDRPSRRLPARCPARWPRPAGRLLFAALLLAGTASAQPRTGSTRAPESERPWASAPAPEAAGEASSTAGGTADAPADPATSPETLLAQGQARAAQRALAEAVARAPDSPALHYQLAVAAAVAGDRVVAREAALAAARLDPGSPPAVALAAGLHLAERGQAPPLAGAEAVQQAERALAEGRLRTAAHLAADGVAAQGEAAAGSGGAGAGRGDAGDTHARLMLVRGLALLGLGRAEEALPALRAAATAGAGGGETWLALGVAYAAAGRPDAAAVCLDVARSSAAPRGAVAAAAREALARGAGPTRLPGSTPRSLRKTGAPR